MYSLFSYKCFFSFNLSGPAYSAGLIGKAPPAVVECHSRHHARSEGRGCRRRARSHSFGPLRQSQVGQEGVFVGRGGGRRAGGGGGGRGEERRCVGPPSGEEVRVECEAVVGGEQGGEGDQAVAIPVLPGRVVRGGGDEGRAVAARAAGISAGVAAVGAEQAVLGAGGVQPSAFAQRDGHGNGLERLGRR